MTEELKPIQFTIEVVGQDISIEEAIEQDAEIIIRGPAKTTLGIFETGLIAAGAVSQ